MSWSWSLTGWFETQIVDIEKRLCQIISKIICLILNPSDIIIFRINWFLFRSLIHLTKHVDFFHYLELPFDRINRWKLCLILMKYIPINNWNIRSILTAFQTALYYWEPIIFYRNDCISPFHFWLLILLELRHEQMNVSVWNSSNQVILTLEYFVANHIRYVLCGFKIENLKRRLNGHDAIFKLRLLPQ